MKSVILGREWSGRTHLLLAIPISLGRDSLLQIKVVT
jgi:hypothetical protein